VLSLIGREIRDQLVYVLAPCVISLMVIGIGVFTFVWGIQEASVYFGGILIAFVFLGFSILGAAQMYGDRANRVSALLSTLAATREKILLSRVIVGGLTVLAALIPVFITAVVLLQLYVPPFEFYSGVVVEVSVALILAGFLCYCVGLQTGWTTSRVVLVGGTLFVTSACASLIAIKGFGPQALLILVLLSAALLVRTWSQFVSRSL